MFKIFSNMNVFFRPLSTNVNNDSMLNLLINIHIFKLQNSIGQIEKKIIDKLDSIFKVDSLKISVKLSS